MKLVMALWLAYSGLGLKFMESYPPMSPHSGPHLGQDFMALAGTPITAIEDGMVLFVGNYLGQKNDNYYETAVEIRVGNRLWSYFHVRPAPGIIGGIEVLKGQVIGHIAQCPIITYGDHLHLELKVYLDPMKFLEGETRNENKK